MTRALIATAALIAGACVAVFTLANAIADHSWMVAGMMAGVVAGFIVAIAPRGAPSLSRYRAEPASRLGPDGLQSTIAQGENQ